MKFPYDNDYLRKVLPHSVANEVVEGIEQFPSQLVKPARSGKHFNREGPFPIRHADLFHSNVIVAKTCDVVGVINWEDSYAVPWGLVDAPCFLSTVPRLLNPPEQYDGTGRPLSQDEAGL